MFRQALGVLRRRGYSRDGLKKAKPCPVLLPHGDQSHHAHSRTRDQSVIPLEVLVQWFSSHRLQIHLTWRMIKKTFLTHNSKRCIESEYWGRGSRTCSLTNYQNDLDAQKIPRHRSYLPGFPEALSLLWTYLSSLWGLWIAFWIVMSIINKHFWAFTVFWHILGPSK